MFDVVVVAVAVDVDFNSCKSFELIFWFEFNFLICDWDNLCNKEGEELLFGKSFFKLFFEWLLFDVDIVVGVYTISKASI